MEPFTVCDHCGNSFSAQRIPLILTRCGHTYCKPCCDTRLLTNAEGRQCPECKDMTPVEHILPNKKVMKVLKIAEQQKTEDQEMNDRVELGSVKS